MALMGENVDIEEKQEDANREEDDESEAEHNEKEKNASRLANSKYLILFIINP